MTAGIYTFPLNHVSPPSAYAIVRNNLSATNIWHCGQALINKQDLLKSPEYVIDIPKLEKGLCSCIACEL